MQKLSVLSYANAFVDTVEPRQRGIDRLWNAGTCFPRLKVFADVEHRSNGSNVRVR